MSSSKWLQRGRARAGAEFADSEITLDGDNWLQRGRARAGAEFRAGVNLVCVKQKGFNGAAPARARNCGTRPFLPARTSQLQRGRARAGAELAPARVARGQPAELQRGRARAGAELRRVRNGR